MVSGAEDALGREAAVGTSFKACVFSTGMPSAHTPEATMLIGNRAPSSLKMLALTD